MCAVFEVSYVRLTARFDANVFLELELEEVCFSANTVHLAFSENVGITATSSFVYRKANETLGTKTIVPVIASDLMQVAGKRVTQA